MIKGLLIEYPVSENEQDTKQMRRFFFQEHIQEIRIIKRAKYDDQCIIFAEGLECYASAKHVTSKTFQSLAALLAYLKG